MGDAPTKAMRRTGIPPTWAVPWGSHICVVYEKKQDLLELAPAYFEAGVEGHEFCLWAISDPITEVEARHALRRRIPDLDRRLEAGQIEVLLGTEWYLQGNDFDLQRVMAAWHRKLITALEHGFQGMRLSGNAFWTGTPYWRDFLHYEHEVNRSIAGKHMIWLCTYGLEFNRAVDLLDVAEAHQHTIVRRNHEWTSVKAPDDMLASPDGRLDFLPQLAGAASLTPMEGVVLAEIVKGGTSKEIAAMFGISPRTVEFHRAHLLKKIGAKNTAELVRKVLGA